jgi:hypothetical protein
MSRRSSAKPEARLKEMLNSLGANHSAWKVFEDFLALSALSISNSVDAVRREEREAKYMDISGGYKQAELEQFTEMFAHFIFDAEANQGGLRDTLGKLFGELGFTDERRGQVFTPQHICDFMGEMLINEKDSEIESKGYISVREPGCGAGAMVLGIANAMRERGYNYQKQMWVYATDIDIDCVYMTYLQLAINGNALSDETWSEWYTPMFVWGGRSARLRHITDSAGLRSDNDSADASAVRSEADSYKETPGGQFALF